MGWQLAPGTGFCASGGELVFLDLARDRYFALQGADRAAFERLQYGGSNDGAAMERLVATGLLQRCDGPSRIEVTSVAVPGQDLAARIDVRSSLAMGMAAARALHWARRAMRPHRIARTIADLAAAKRKIGVGAERPAQSIAATYAASRWLAPIAPRCLIDALALDRILIARGLAVSLVFGVHLKPFRAHCWLQTPETILTGTAAEARNFTPILVVG